MPKQPNIEKILEEFDKKFYTPLDWITLNCHDEIICGVDMDNIDEELKLFLKSSLQNTYTQAREETIKEILEMIEGEKITKANRGYDGNNLESACQKYYIGAENWTEIVRFEDGHNEALQTLSDKVKEIK